MAKLTRRSALTTLAAAAAAGVLLPKATLADQPHMKAAQDALKLAQKELQEATADKGGHRAKAIALVNDALVEVQKGIDFVKNGGN